MRGHRQADQSRKESVRLRYAISKEVAGGLRRGRETDDRQVRAQSLRRNECGLHSSGDRACGLCACVRYWIPALAHGLPRLDRQFVGVLQGGHALFQGRMQNLVISFKGGNLS